MPDELDAKCMREALALAKMGYGLTNPNPMVGAVLVQDGDIIGRGFHLRAGEAHAEINALDDAAKHGGAVKNSTLYVTLEPCSTYGRTPPCTKAIIAAGIKRVVIGALDPNPVHNGRAVGILRDAGIEVVTGVENAECSELNREFFQWAVTKKPFVTLKLAVTLDGRIATASGNSKWITGPEARARVQRLRRMADAILIGGETFRADRPALTVRTPENWPRQPLRLIASSSLTRDDLAECYPDGNFELVELRSSDDWEALLAELGSRGMISLLIEGGGELAASAIAAKAVDYAEFHIAPKLLGGRNSRPALGGDDPETLADAKMLHRVKCEACGSDFIISGYLKER